MSRALARSLGLKPPVSGSLVVGRGAGTAGTARVTVSVKLSSRVRRALKRMRKGTLTLRVTASDPAGNTKVITKSIRPKVR
jgi:hypothetical protein